MLHQNSWFQLNNADSDHQIWYGAVVGDTVDNVDVDIDMSSYHKIKFDIWYSIYIIKEMNKLTFAAALSSTVLRI